MANEEKRINVVIEGNADNLNDEIDRVGKNASEAFKEIGFDEVLNEAADKFEKRIDQFKHVLNELKNDRIETHDIYNKRIKATTNPAAIQREEKERDERLSQNAKATDALRKAMENFTKKFEQGKVDEFGKSTAKPKDDEKRTEEESEGKKTDRTNQLGNNITRGFMQLMQGNVGSGMRSIFKGGGGGAGAEAAEGEAAGGGGIGGGLLAALAVMLGVKAWKMGNEDLRADNRLRAMGAGNDYFGSPTDYGDFSGIGINQTSAKKLMLADMQSAVGLGRNNKTSGNDDELKQQIFNLTRDRQYFQTAYGIDENNQRGLDPFLRQNSKGATQMMAELMISGRGMMTTQGGNVLGSLANEKLTQMIKLMEQQKEVSIRTNSTLAVSLLKSGSTIGGQFADDRGGDKMGGIVNNLSSSNNEVVKAMVMQILLKKYGNLSEALSAREQLSSNPEDLRLVMQTFGKRFGGGEAAKLMLGSSGMGVLGSQTDANSFLNGKGFQTTANQIATDQANQNTLTEKTATFMEALTERAKNLVLNTDALQIKAANVSIVTGKVMSMMATNNGDAVQENPVK